MRALILMVPALVAGCAMAGDGPAGRERTALDRDLAERVAGPAEACLPRRQNQSLRAVDRRTIVYDDGRILWVNRLEANCSGLRLDSILIVETFADRYCRNDRIRALEPGSPISGPACRLGSFTPYRRR
jgi:hypothetical protein